MNENEIKEKEALIKKIKAKKHHDKIYPLDIPEKYASDMDIIIAERESGSRKIMNCGYDVINDEFFVCEAILYLNGFIEENYKEFISVFPDFDKFYNYLSGDIYNNACYFQYDFSKTTKKIDFNKFLANLSKILAKNEIDFKNTRFIITGHSRGAAVGNIIAHDLMKEYGCSPSNVYDYNFATPDVGHFDRPGFIDMTPIGSDSVIEYDNIYNIGNCYDPISMIPSELVIASSSNGITWDKFGHSFWFCEDSWSECVNFYAKKMVNSDLYYFNDALQDDIIEIQSKAGEYHPSERYVEYLKNEPDLLSFRPKSGLVSNLNMSIFDFLSYSLNEDESLKITGVKSPIFQEIKIPSSTVLPGTITDPRKITGISSKAFSGYNGLESISLTSNITSIGSSAFSNCTSLTKVILPSKLKEISASTFSGCKELSSIGIPASVTTIKTKAFYNCSSLKRITIPKTVTTIEEKAFGYIGDSVNEEFEIVGTVGSEAERYANENNIKFIDVTTLKDDTNDDSDKNFEDDSEQIIVTSPESDFEFYTEWWETVAIYRYLGDSTIVKIPSEGSFLSSDRYPVFLLGDDRESVFKNDNIKRIIIPDTVKYINSLVFAGCINLESVEIPKSVISIGAYAFSGCSSIENIIIPDSVELIGNGDFYYGGTFSNCKSLKSITLSKSILYLPKLTFDNCSSLESITIPNSITRIEDSAFYACSSLKDVYFSGTEKEWNKIIIDNVGNECLLNATIHFNSSESTTTAPPVSTATINTTTTTAKVTSGNVSTAKPSTTTKASISSVKGDANCNGSVEIADAVAILQYLANASKYPLSEQGKKNADVDGIAGVSGLDALTIQKYGKRKISSIPQKKRACLSASSILY